MNVFVVRTDGGCKIITPAPGYEARVEKELQPGGYIKTTLEELPARGYTEALRIVDGVVVVDMPTARKMYRNRLRRMRSPMLAALDVEYMRADEAADAARKTEIATEKQRLRDITQDPRIEACATVAELEWLSLI